MDFSEILKESQTVQADDFLKVADEAIETLSEGSGAASFSVEGKLARLEPIGEALVVGDLHGDLASLGVIMKQSGFPQKMAAARDTVAIFLGDYGDRGAQSPEVYFALLRLKLAFPGQVVLLRGNHEGPSDLMASPHDLPLHLRRKFGDHWVGIYQRLMELFSYLYNAAYVEDKYLMVHGGISQKLRSLQDVADADKLHPEKPFLEELLWNDPDEHVRGAFPSARGAGWAFGKDVTAAVLERLGAKILIRGHEPSRDGYMIGHGGRVLTLFSRRGPPYYNDFGAYLQVPLKETFQSASQLLPYIHKF